jgi:hypothetical protein
MSNGNQLEDHDGDMMDTDAQDLRPGVSFPNRPDNSSNASTSHGLGNPLTNASTQSTHISDGNTQVYEPPVYNQPDPFMEGSRVALVDQSRQGYEALNSGRPPDLMHHGRRRPMVCFPFA